jgi:pimeloyl-ACP methyl ester carboxylesterase
MSRFILFIALLFPLVSTVEAAEPISLKTDSGELYGTLEIPKDAHAVPVALIISGSGPTDRDGNNPLVGTNNSLKMLSEGLVAKGIASLRYDKRGIAASAAAGPKEADLRFDMYIDDAERWGNLLLHDRWFAQLIVIGHSEGALVGAVACGRLAAQGFISIGGAGYPAFELLEAQLKKNLPPGLLSESNTILDLLKKGMTTDKVPPSLMALFRPSVQPYLISWFRYDPTYEVSRLVVPTLVVQGTTDIQVGTSDAERLAKSNKLARLSLVEGMNHVLKSVPGDPGLQMKSYGDPDLPISQNLVDKIAAFIKELSDKK